MRVGIESWTEYIYDMKMPTPQRKNRGKPDAVIE